MVARKFEVKVAEEFGALAVWAENLPSPENPMVSYIAALSSIATIVKARQSQLQAGTCGQSQTPVKSL